LLSNHKKCKLLVLGANSFIGKNYLKNTKYENITATYYSKVPPIKFVKKKYKYKKVNIKNYQEVIKIIKNECIDIVINFTADNNNKIEQSVSIKNIFDLNLLGFINLVEAVKNLNKKIIIYNFTSTEVKNNKLSPYSLSKHTSEKIQKIYNNLYKMKIHSIKLNNIFGPGDMNFSRLIPFICKNFCEDKSIDLYSVKKNKIFKFTYIDDLTSFIDYKIKENKNKNSIKKIKFYKYSTLNIYKMLSKLHINYFLKNHSSVPTNNNIENKLYSTLKWYKENL